MQGANFSEWGSGFCSSFGHGPWFFGWLFQLLFWGVIAYFLLIVVRHFLSDKPSEQVDSALDILRNRYASGEINEQEYTTHKAILSRR